MPADSSTTRHEQDALDTQRLSDRIEIEQLIYSWAHASDNGKLTDAPMVFTEDCIVDYDRSPSGPIHGRSNYAAMVREAFSNDPVTASSRINARAAACQHHFSNLSLRFTSADTAEVTSYAASWMKTPAGATCINFSRFDDTVVRTAIGWKIAVRRNRLTSQMMRTPEATV